MLKQRGIALFQVLALTSILIVLAISVTYAARKQVNVALGFSHRAQAQLLMDSAEAHILFELLTKEHDQVFTGAQGWNLRGEPFVLTSGVRVEILDAAGLLSPGRSPAYLWARAFDYFGAHAAVAENLATELLQKTTPSTRVIGFANQNIGLGGPMQIEQELRALPGMPADVFKAIVPYVSWFPSRWFNPNAAPLPLLEAIWGPEQASMIAAARNQNILDDRMLFSIVGQVDEERIRVFPSGLYQIKWRAQVKDFSLERKLVVWFQPQKATMPLMILSRS